MAANGKKTVTSGKKAGTRKPGRPRKNQAPEPESFIRAEVFIILSFALAVLLFLSNFHLCGVAGDFLRTVQLGIFGMVGFIAPLLLFTGTCFYLSNRGNRMAVVKILAVAAAVLALCSFAQLFLGGELEEGQNIMEYYRMSSANGKGGGLIGGLICGKLVDLFGKVGAFLVLFVCFIISAVLITERSVVRVVQKHGDAAYRYAKEDMDRRREIHAEKLEEKRRLREEQRVRGVNLDSTKLEEPAVTMEAVVVPDMDIVPDPEGTASPADVFTGNIALPPDYVDDDTVPFDMEGAAAQIYKREASLVADDEGRMRDPDGVFIWKGEPDPDVLAAEPEPESENRVTSSGRGAVRAEAYPSDLEIIDDEGAFGAGGILEENVAADAFYIPEEPKQVVTAGGKVIDTDTEELKKKLESKKKAAKEAGETSVQQQIQEKQEEPKKEYVFPPVSLLKRGSRSAGSYSEKEYKETAIKLQQTLKNFGVGVTVTNISCGPSVTRYELHPEQGVKVSKIVGLSDDIKLSLAAEDIRIEAPIPGKSAVGIEVPNKENNMVYLRDLFEADAFKKHASSLAFAVGKDIGGQVVVTDIAKMPHLLIAGATGSGKSVCINTLIMSIIYKSKPEDVKLIMVDPKVVELSVYNGIPHLLIPVVTDPKKASGALNWAVAEMTDRYKKFAEYNVRDLKGYNAKVEKIKDIEDDKKPKRLPQIVIIVDELADLMMVAPGEVEDAICRLAQLARAAGIHLVIATQRPSVNVITGLIKANVPSRIAFSVSSGVDSRTIIDMNGAEKLLGKGDMLFYPAGFPKPQRVQGAFVSDQEVQRVVDFLTEQGMTPDYSPEVESQMNAAPSASAAGGGGNGRDEYFDQAAKFIIEKEKASIGMLQRMFKIGFNRAARIMDQLAEAGIVGEEEGTKPRKVLMTMEEFGEMMERGE